MMTTNSRKMRKFDEVVQESWVVYYGVKNIREMRILRLLL